MAVDLFSFSSRLFPSFLFLNNPRLSEEQYNWGLNFILFSS